MRVKYASSLYNSIRGYSYMFSNHLKNKSGYNSIYKNEERFVPETQLGLKNFIEKVKKKKKAKKMIVFVGLLRTRCSYSLKLMPVRLSIAELRLPNTIFCVFPTLCGSAVQWMGAVVTIYFFFQNFKFGGYHIPSINVTTTSFTTAANDMACWAIGHTQS